MFEEQTFDYIMQRMLSNVPSNVDKREGSIIWDALAGGSLELARAYSEMDSILNIALARKSYGEFLDLICESHGVKRKKAQYSSGYAVVEGAPLFRNRAPIQIKVNVKDVILKYIIVDENNTPIDLEFPPCGKIQVKLLCTTPGAVGNIPTNTIELTEYIPGIEKMYNTEPFKGGVNEEDDLSLLGRLLERVQNPPSSGNVKDYTRWAKEVPGVKNVKVIPRWNGGGTVKLIVFGDKGMPIDNEIVKNVKSYIDPVDGLCEGKAPVGANVTVVTVVLKELTISISGLKVKEGYKLDSVKLSIEQNILKFLESILPGSIVVFKAVEAVITNAPGVFDFDTLKINDKNTNFSTNAEEKVILKEVKYFE